MNKIYSKERNEEMRLRNVLKYLQDRRNELVGQHKQEKKDKNKDEQARLLAEKHKVEADIADISNRANEANKVAYKVAVEMAMLRTKMYVLSYCLQGAVFDLNEYLKQHAQDDGGEVAFCEELRKCSDLLMTMPLEFGEYGGQDNESFNVCEEIISKEVDRGVRAAFDEMMAREIDKLK